MGIYVDTYMKANAKSPRRQWLMITLFFLLVVGGVALLHLRLAGLRYVASYPLLAHVSSSLFDLNHIDIRVADNLQKDDFRIVNLNSGQTVFESSRYLGGIKNEYGWCLFNVYYKNKLYFQVGHNKFNNWHANYYTFIFRKSTGQIDPTLVIEGPDHDNGTLFYKRFERNQAVYFGSDKRVYLVEDVKQ